MTKTEEQSLKSILLTYVPDGIELADIQSGAKIKNDLLIDSLSFISLVIDIEKNFNIKLKMNSELFNDNVSYEAVKYAIQTQLDNR